MNWQQAVSAMIQGEHVRRRSDIRRDLIAPSDGETPAVYFGGTEGCFLAAAWSEKEEPVLVFMGSSSRVPFVPDDEHRSATDWVIEDRSGGSLQYHDTLPPAPNPA